MYVSGVRKHAVKKVGRVRAGVRGRSTVAPHSDARAHEGEQRVFSVVAPAIVLGALFSFPGTPPGDAIGVKMYGNTEGLALCPPSPNCISSSSEPNDSTHYAPALRTPKGQSPEQAAGDIKSVLASASYDNFTPQLQTKDGRYVYATFSSPTFNFTDDVEALVRSDGSVLLRSASRLGENDNGINSKRITALQNDLKAKGFAIAE